MSDNFRVVSGIRAGFVGSDETRLQKHLERFPNSKEYEGARVFFDKHAGVISILLPDKEAEDDWRYLD